MPAVPARHRLINLALRSLTLACRFLLVFLLARFLGPGELGQYGLLAAAISYALYLVGLDFYTFTTREIVGRPPAQWGGVLKGQAWLAAWLYLGCLPLLALALAAGWLPPGLAAWFLLLLVLEHLNQEIGRFLTAVSAPVAASLVYFLRAGLWIIGIAVLMWRDPARRELETVLLAWTAGGLSAFCLGAWRLHALGLAGWATPVDRAWIRRGVRVALPLLAGTLALRALFTLDRYWLAALADMQVVGAYVMFAGVAQAVIVFLDSGVFAFAYPALIQAHKAGDAAAFRRRLRRLWWHTLILSLGYAVAALLLIHPLLEWIGNPFYREHLVLLYGAVLYSTLYAIGMVPHYALYAQSLDRPLLQAHVLGLAVFVLVTVLSLPAGGMAVLYGLGAAFVAILGWKGRAYRIHTPAVYRSGS